MPLPSQKSVLNVKQIPRHLHHPSPLRISADPNDLHRPAPDVDREEHVVPCIVTRFGPPTFVSMP